VNDYPGLREMLKQHEGVVPYVYKDSLGYDTIGVGFLVDKKKGGTCPPPVIDFWLDYLISQCKSDLLSRLPWVSSISPIRQDCLLDMAYNLGVVGLMGFAQTLAHIKAGEYEAAAQGMLQSRWASQVGLRATHLAHIMASGTWIPLSEV
jgi:lysozyme